MYTVRSLQYEQTEFGVNFLALFTYVIHVNEWSCRSLVGSVLAY